MTPELAEKITQLFTKTAGSYPYFAGDARIQMTNAAGSKFDLTARTPADCAQMLAMLGSDRGLFRRAAHFRTFSPLQLAFDQNMRAPDDDKTHRMRALNFTFRGGEHHSWVAVVGQEGLHRGPTLDETVDILTRAGNNWQKVNFVYKENGSHLRVVR
jgi:hypothetical protein